MPRLTYKDFEASINQPFQIHFGADQLLTVTLTEFRLWGQPAPDEKPDAYQPFTIVFQSDITQYLPQATYRIANERIGDHDIFIVPLGPNKLGVQYEAVFS